MISKIKNYLLLGFGVALLLLVFYVQHLAHKLEREKDMSGYYKTESEKTAKIFKDKDSLYHIQTEANIISAEAFKKLANDHSSQLYKLTQRFGIKPKNTVAINTTTVENETKLNIKIKDTIINNSDTISLIKYADRFITINGVIRKNVLSGSIVYTDSLDQIVYRDRKKVLGLKIGKASYKSELVSKNPNTKIVANRFVMIRK